MATNTEKRRVEIVTRAEQSTASINELRTAARLLQNELNKLPKDSEEFRKAVGKWRDVDTRLKTAQNEVRGLDNEMGRLSKTTTSFWGQFKTIAAGVFGGNLLTSAGSYLSSALGGMVSGRKKAADEMADIAKTTGMATEEVRVLDRELAKLDSRTSQSGLRELAVQAGKLGITGVDNVRKFVQEMDQIQVALGEDLGADAVLQIGKMTKVYNTGALNIASAVNAIGQASEASEGYLVDFAARLGGAAKSAKVSAPDIIGYGAVLDMMGLQVEMSSTALSKFIIDFVKDSAKFEQAAGMQKGALAKIIGEKGTNEGLLAFIENLKKSTKSEDEFLMKLDEVGIDGSRGAAVFLTLSNNIDRVRQQQALANVEFQKATSITNEYNTKNNNFAASLEKIGKKLYDVFVNNPISDTLEDLVNWLADTRTEADKLADSFLQQKNEVDGLKKNILPLLDRYEVLKGKTTLTADEQTELKNIIEDVSLAIPGAVTEFDSYGNALDINAQKARQFVTDQALALRSMNREAITAIDVQIQKKKTDLAAISKDLNYLNTKYVADMKTTAGAQFRTVESMEKQKNAMLSQKQQDAAKLRQEIEEDEARRRQLTGETVLNEQKRREEESLKITQASELERIEKEKKLAAKKAAADAKQRDAELKREKKHNDSLVDDKERMLREELNATKEYVDQWYAAQEAILKNEYIQGTISKQELDDSLEKLEIEHLTAMRVAYIDYGQDVSDIDVKIADNKIKQMDRVGKAADKFDKKPTNFLLGPTGKHSKDKPESLEQRKAQWNDYAQDVLSLYNNIVDLTNARTDAEIAADKKIFDNRIANLDAQKEAGLINEVEYNKRRQAFEDEFNAKQRAARKKQFEAQRTASILEAIYNTAVGVTSALKVAPPAGFVLAGLVGAAGALQIAKIASQPVPEFAAGGSTLDITGASGRRYNRLRKARAEGYYGTPTYVVGEQGGEYVIPNWLYRHPSAVNMMQAIDAAVANKNVGYVASAGSGNDALAGAISRLNQHLENGINARMNWDEPGYQRYKETYNRSEDLSKFS